MTRACLWPQATCNGTYPILLDIRALQYLTIYSLASFTFAISFSLQVAPSEIQLIVKTHKSAIFVQTPLSSTLQTVKSNVLSAITQFAASGTLEDVPNISSEDDFELYRLDNSRFVALDASKGIRDQKVTAWTTLYIRFKDAKGEFLHWRMWLEPSQPVVFSRSRTKDLVAEAYVMLHLCRQLARG